MADQHHDNIPAVANTIQDDILKIKETLGFHKDVFEQFGTGWSDSDASGFYAAFTQSGTGASSRTQQNKSRETFSATDFGLSTSAAAADNTTYFHAAVAAMTAGSRLIIPPGDYNVTNLVFNPPDECSLECHGRFVSAAAGVAFTIGDALTATTFVLKYHITNLKVKSNTEDHTAGRVGVLIHNCYGSYIDIRYVYGFETGVKCYGEARGVSYNEIHIGYIEDNKYSIHCDADATGWVNENNFHGGELTWTTSHDTDGWRHIWLDNCTNIVNNNRFYGVSLESNATTGDNSPLAIGVYCEGESNFFYGLRYEMDSADLKIFFTSNSVNNVVFYGFGLENGWDGDVITDSGTYNQIFTKNQIKVAGGNADYPILRVHNGNSDTKPAIGVYDALGTTLKWHVASDGKVYNAGTQILTSQQTGVSAMTNVSAPSNLNADTVSVAELADIVGTLIVKLRAHGLVAN